ncbi:MAG TPA: energy-coupling factor ABC transporter substrate-binding protein [Methanomicrobiales archaeon]|nr:energy-coupling factor ABC transporter substrate-binding protein [Methanomicrobiales archaeon]
MFQNRKLEILTLIGLAVFVVLFIIVSGQSGHEFSGSDDVGSAKIAEITGRSVEDFKPLIPQYVPPSGEIESTLFALQATFGGVVVGLVIGYWYGQRKRPGNP